MFRHLAVVPTVLVLSACAPALTKGLSTENDVRRTMGAPAVELSNPDGSRQLAYPKGPLGTETFMVFVRRDGVVERFEQVLTDDSFARIQSGQTTRDDVRRLIGPPWRVVRFENLHQDAWDYRFRDTWGYLADFSVMIDDRGVVASKITARIESGRDSPGFNR